MGCFTLDDEWIDCNECEFYDECMKRIIEEDCED